MTVRTTVKVQLETDCRNRNVFSHGCNTLHKWCLQAVHSRCVW